MTSTLPNVAFGSVDVWYFGSTFQDWLGLILGASWWVFSLLQSRSLPGFAGQGAGQAQLPLGDGERERRERGWARDIVAALHLLQRLPNMVL